MPKYRPPFVSKKGKLLKFVLPYKYVARLEEEMQKSGLGWHGTGKQLLINTLSYPKYTKFIEIMKLIKEFEASLLE